MIPEEIKKYEDACALIMQGCLNGKNSPETLNALHTIMSFYETSLKDKDAEIERLKGLMPHAFNQGILVDSKDPKRYAGVLWEQFAKENNL